MQSYCERFHSMYNDSDPDTDCYCIVQNNTKTEVESEARIEYKLGQRKFTNKLTKLPQSFRRVEIFGWFRMSQLIFKIFLTWNYFKNFRQEL